MELLLAECCELNQKDKERKKEEGKSGNAMSLSPICKRKRKPGKKRKGGKVDECFSLYFH